MFVHVAGSNRSHIVATSVVEYGYEGGQRSCLQRLVDPRRSLKAWGWNRQTDKSDDAHTCRSCRTVCSRWQTNWNCLCRSLAFVCTCMHVQAMHACMCASLPNAQRCVSLLRNVSSLTPNQISFSCVSCLVISYEYEHGLEIALLRSSKRFEAETVTSIPMSLDHGRADLLRRPHCKENS
jgi:hypothetical protein